MGGLFGGKVPPAPEPQDPAVMPDENGPQMREKRRLQVLDSMNRKGRDSTILSSPGSRASTTDYSRSTLGGA